LAAAIALASPGCSPRPEATLAHFQTDLWLAAPESARTAFAFRRQRSIRALELESERALAFDLELGSAPRLSFRPIASGDGACRFAVDAAVRGGPVARVATIDAGPSPDALPREVDVDLAAFAGGPIALSLSASAVDGSACRAFVGSPVVVDRRERQRVRGLAARAPNVLFLAADTLRADALGFHGRAPSPTPALDAFAAQSHVWLDAFSSINNTNPSFASLMTGKYVKNHRVFDLSSRLPDAHVTLAEVLSQAGYDTKAVISVAHLGRSGLRQGFDAFTRPGKQFYAETVVDIAVDWLSQPSERPFFLWLHFFDPHMPHTPPSPYDEGLHPAAPYGADAVASWVPFRELGKVELDASGAPASRGSARLYHGEVAYLDRQIDRLLGFLASTGQLDDTLVVFVADHGETLGERLSFFDHVGLYDETTHVPLVVRTPGQREGAVHRGLVQHFDVFPTVLGQLGLPVPPQDGVDLLPKSGDALPRASVFANHANDRGEMMRTQDFLYLVNRGIPRLPNGPHLYDLASDPHAQTDIAGGGVAAEAELARDLARWKEERVQTSEPEREVLGDEERRQLEALGYVD